MSDSHLFQNLGTTRRNPERIEEFLDAFSKLWHAHPDQRFGQIVSNLKLGEFYREDDDALALIENQLEWDKQSNSKQP